MKIKNIIMILLTMLTVSCFSQENIKLESNYQCLKEKDLQRECSLEKTYNIKTLINQKENKFFIRINHGQLEMFMIYKITEFKTATYIELLLKKDVTEPSDLYSIRLYKNQKQFDLIYAGGLVVQCKY